MTTRTRWARRAAATIAAAGSLLLGAQCGAAQAKCPIGYVYEHGNQGWGCYPSH